MKHTPLHPPRRLRGSALSLMVIVAVVLTSLIIATAWAASVQANMAGRLPRLDDAYYAAESAAQQACWKFKHDNQWRAAPASPFTGSISINGVPFSFTASCTSNTGTAALAWKFDEDAGNSTADSSGHGNTGTFHGGVTWDPNGRSGSCIDLDGVDGYVDCGNNSSTNLTGDLTFSAWVKMNSGAYDQKIGGNQDGVSGGYKLCIYNSKVEFEVRDASNVARLDRDVTGGRILVMGSWYHVVGVYDSVNHIIKTYVDGQFDRQLTGLPANALGPTTGRFVMGKEPWDSLYYFNGSMDDIRIFNRVLSQSEIQSLYDTTVDIAATATDGTVSNTVSYSASIPTPPPPTLPAVTIAGDFPVKDSAFNGDLAVRGTVAAANPNSTITGNLNYGNKITGGGHLTVTGASTKVATPTNISMPSIDLAGLRNQASTYGQVVSATSTGQTFTFNSLGGNKVIWIKGDLVNPTVTIGGTYAAGGTFIVDGQVKFTSGAQSVGLDGYPVYFVSVGNFTQSGTSLTLYGGIYAQAGLNFNSLNVTGPVVVNGPVTNNDTAPSIFNADEIPWFDNRIIPQTTATLPMYTTNHRGIGP
ncbi:MAG TPA: LamG domain-containing protein [Phycisphaerae bacterium]|nr:LamG domain-containing protein [Phycisphaerae bacterium]